MQQSTIEESTTTPGEITDFVKQAIAELLEQRDRDYQAAIAPFEAEQTALEREHASLAESLQGSEKLLPSQSWVAQYESAKFVVDGRHEEAAIKLAELEQTKQIPVAMRARQQAIAARFQDIEEEKRAALLRATEAFRDEVFRLNRDVEAAHAHVIVETKNILGEIESKLQIVLYQVAELTGDEYSEAWNVLTRLYRGNSRK